MFSKVAVLKNSALANTTQALRWASSNKGFVEQRLRYKEQVQLIYITSILWCL
jgi:hypothetical protein